MYRTSPNSDIPVVPKGVEKHNAIIMYLYSIDYASPSCGMTSPGFPDSKYE